VIGEAGSVVLANRNKQYQASSYAPGVRIRQDLHGRIRAAPEELGEPPPGSKPRYPYERCTLWLLYRALSYGIDTGRFLSLWNGSEGWTRGTAQMYQEVNRRNGRVTWIDSRSLLRAFRETHSSETAPFSTTQAYECGTAADRGNTALTLNLSASPVLIKAFTFQEG